MRPKTTHTSRPRIAVVGAGFAGLTAARELGRQFSVTVLDRSPWFEWLPNIHELLSGVKRSGDLRLPHRALVARSGHRFVQSTVTAIDAGAGRLVTSGGRSIGFDACIVAVGGVHDTFGVPGADRHAMSFKCVDDCDAIGRRLAQLAARPGRLSVVIVGVIYGTLGLLVQKAAIGHLVGLAFNVAASTFAPIFLMGVWWRGMTEKGALWGMVVGLLSSCYMIFFVSTLPVWMQWRIPGLVTVPLAFLTVYIVSKIDGQVPADVNAFMRQIHSPDVPKA